VVRDSSKRGGRQGAGIFEFKTGVGPEGEVGVDVCTGLFGRDQAGGSVVVARIQVLRYLKLKGIFLGIGLEAVKSFWEVQ
jgi:hypothetical protein